MKTFNVYFHSTHGFEAVKVGFSWPALFFNFFWMAVKKLWGLAAVFLIINILIRFVAGFKNQFDGSIFTPLLLLLLFAADLALILVPGFKGNAWRDRHLVAQGYRQLATLQAETPEVAAAQARHSFWESGSSQGA